jgi:tetratricopeptide (TPR) repeat protein
VAAWNREESLEPLVAEAERARARKDWRAAVALLDRARGYGALLPKEWALLGHCRAEIGDIDGAIAAFVSVVAVDATSMQAHNMLARLHARRGEPDAAARHAGTFIRIASQEPDPDGFLAREIATMRLSIPAPESR